MSIMTMHTLVRMVRTQAYRNTAQFVHEINNQLVEQSLVNDEGGFITLLYAILDVKKEELQWTSAGHPIPMLQDLATGDVHVVGPDDAGGLPLAIIPDADYETHTTKIPANSRILFCTDGLEEAFPEKATGKHIQFGIDGIIESMKQTTNQSLEKAVKALFDDSNAFTQGSGRHDDTSVVLLQRS
jgi:serine phosphatase RsbU (regulator of sigma subunit)